MSIENLQLGKLLQIVFSDGVRNQISTDFRDFEMIKRAKVSSSVARELRFMFQKSLGAAAIQYRNAGQSNRAFPAAQQASVSEHTAKFKEIDATIELEYNLWNRARKSPEKYAEPLALEIASKTSASKRRLAADLYTDGTGVVGTVASAVVTSPASSNLVFTLSTANTARGHVGQFEFEDILVLKSAANGASALNTSLATEAVSWKVIDKDFDNNKVTLQGLDVNGAPVASMTAISAQPTAGDVFYRIGQPTTLDLTAAIADYGTATEVIAGLESLAATDGRVIHGITMSGATGASKVSAGGQPIDVKHIQKVMSKVKRAVGQDRYTWKMATMQSETLDSLIDSRETDRRFMSIDDNARGVKKFVYQHQNDSLEMYTSEYVGPKRIWILPETKAGEKVLEFHGSDFETVKANDSGDFHLKSASGGGYVNTVVSYLQAIGTLICKHPAAVACIDDFTAV